MNEVLTWTIARPVAHRGLHDRATLRLENTMSAAQAAIDAGFGIECDIQLSSDGEAMVFHDHTLDRLTAETGPVRAREAAELGRLRIGGSADTIPTLDAFLDAIGGRTPVVIEVKSRFDGDLRLTERLVAILARRDDPVVVKSFDPEIVAHLRQIAPTLARGIVGQSRYDGGDVAALPAERITRMTTLADWDAMLPDFISWRAVDLPQAEPVAAHRAAGVPVMTWTVRSAQDAAMGLERADQIVFEGFVPAPGTCLVTSDARPEIRRT